MTTIEDLGERLRDAGMALVAALFPAPENARLGQRWGVDVARASFLLGLVEAPVGGLGFFFGAIAAICGVSPLLGRLLLENWFQGLSNVHVAGTGMVALLVWCCHPLAWLLVLEGVTGVLRIVAFVTHGEPHGEPLVWLALRTAHLAARGARRSARARDLGPLRPDRLVWDAGCDLEILTCRERPEWGEGVVLEVEGRFFRLIGVTDRADPPHVALAYRFSELDPNEVIRRLVHYADVVSAANGGAAHSASEAAP